MFSRQKAIKFLKKNEHRIVFVFSALCIALISFNVGRLSIKQEGLKIVERGERLALEFTGLENDQLVFKTLPQATVKLGEDQILDLDQEGRFSVAAEAKDPLKVYTDKEFLEIDLNKLLNLKSNIAGAQIENKTTNQTTAGQENKNEAKQGSEVEKVFVGSKNSDKYHTLDCSYAKRIKEENKVWFSSKEEAQSQGYQPDKCVK